MKAAALKTSLRLAVIGLLMGAQGVQAQQARDLWVVQMPGFCQKITNIMQTFATQQGLDTRASMRLADKATGVMITQLKTGKLNPYLDASTMEVSASPKAEPARQWLSVPEVLVSAMGRAPRNVILIDQVNELRFLSQAAPRSQILLLADGQGEVDASRAKLVAQTAQALGLEMNVIWAARGKDPATVKAAQGFALMSSMTGGAFLDITSSHGCGGI